MELTGKKNPGKPFHGGISIQFNFLNIFLFFLFPGYWYICDALHDLILLVRFKKCEKHPWRCDAFSKPPSPTNFGA